MRLMRSCGRYYAEIFDQIQRDGDLLFSCSKDQQVNVWYSTNGERLGTYDGHNGTVWTCDTGKCLFTWEFPTAVKRVAFSESGDRVVCVTEQRMGYQGAIRIFAINRSGDGTQQSEEPINVFHPLGTKATVVAFAHKPNMLVTGHESGKVALFNADTGEEVESNQKAHMEAVTDIQLAPDRSYFITSSRDKTAKLHETATLNVLKTYATETPLNSASVAPVRPYILLGGGQDAGDVTRTSARQGKFETRFWHKIFEEEVGRVRGHFGPINTLAVHPDGKSYASGGEDGFVRVHHFDESYFKSRPYGEFEPEP
ncbi:WD40 repeat-like protein [Auriculariales sp. MPI-PUGE-AT-0066]|nr:WD40 repeat-like protein [Auriculariales sp. MPI-PUGE-AT-0066]